jgi:hypothetical protein
MQALFSIGYYSRTGLQSSEAIKELINILTITNTSFEININMPGWLDQKKEWIEFESLIYYNETLQIIFPSIEGIEKLWKQIGIALAGDYEIQVSIKNENGYFIPYTQEVLEKCQFL